MTCFFLSLFWAVCTYSLSLDDIHLSKHERSHLIHGLSSPITSIILVLLLWLLVNVQDFSRSEIVNLLKTENSLKKKNWYFHDSMTLCFGQVLILTSNQVWPKKETKTLDLSIEFYRLTPSVIWVGLKKHTTKNVDTMFTPHSSIITRRWAVIYIYIYILHEWF